MSDIAEQTIEEFYVAAYDMLDRNGDTQMGFIENDPSSDFPCFSKNIPTRIYRRKTVGEAAGDVRMIQKTMTTYFGSDKVDFDSVRVVKVKTTMEEIDDLDAQIEADLIKSAREKLTDEELAALARAAKLVGTM